MRRKRALKIVLLAIAVCMLLVGSMGGYLWYSFSRAAERMYEPLPQAVDRLPSGMAANSDPASSVIASSKIAGTGFGAAQAADDGAGEAVAGALADRAQADGPPSEVPAVIPADQVARLRHPDLKNQDPFFLLVLGVDQREGDRGRSDTMLLLGINPRTASVSMLSIPRDTRLMLPQLEREEKINHAYAYGGTGLAVQAVERLLGIPIAYYVKTNMEGFVGIVDAVGGVTIADNDLAFSNLGYRFPLGKLELDGQMALAYARMRYDDPQGDFGRTGRQRQVLKAIAQRMSGVGQASKLPGLLKQLSGFVKTNLKRDEMIRIAAGYHAALNHTDTLKLNGRSQTIGGLYYWVVSPAERQRVGEALWQSLSPPA
ncbi:LCP family glycopolymer transferase [Cohnella nanjingensis]|uniref:LCP family protein n=1 Tax=Cohnella nanjingensis TaxID=1387779 RepID=A0A7X0RQB5_9BACL|nr:LCP family protein [Cohnella nanjingensis]MBB6671729.1 LCP family protein [Cohnella nanjingensis]